MNSAPNIALRILVLPNRSLVAYKAMLWPFGTVEGTPPSHLLYHMHERIEQVIAQVCGASMEVMRFRRLSARTYNLKSI